jgi:phosphoribosylamine--glycine ligase
LRVRSGAALTVVLASAGYPASSDKGREISGLEEDDDRGDVIVFHAGTARRDDGAIVTAGGRVLGVTGLGDSLAAARDHAYAALTGIRFEGMFHRSDIGARSLGAAASPGRSS